MKPAPQQTLVLLSFSCAADSSSDAAEVAEGKRRVDVEMGACGQPIIGDLEIGSAGRKHSLWPTDSWIGALEIG